MNYIYHSGILGMRWGVRKSSRSGSSGGSKRRSEGSQEYKTTRKLLKKKTKNLSNAELKELTSRFQLEKQYKDLKPVSVKRGMDAAKTITAAGATIGSLYALSKTPLAQGVKSAVLNAAKKSKEKWVL